MGIRWGKQLVAILLAVFAVGTLTTGAQPSACAGAHVPYCVAESLTSPGAPVAIPAAVMPAVIALAFAFLAIAFFTTIRDDGRTRLALLRRSAPDSGPWTHRHRNHLAPLASPHGD